MSDKADAIRSIPLGKLVKSPANVRKTPPTEAEQAELKANIAAHGLHQNLVVQRARRKGVFEVIAGGRRLDILKELQAEGALPADYAAPCKVRAGRDDAEEISLSENAVRAAMNPADEFEAFARLIDSGQTVADIARRFGTTEKHVHMRLKLGRVAPQVLKAYRAGEMDLEILMAFTLSDDHKAQRAVWKQVKDEYHVSAHGVRRRLTEKTVPVNSRLGRFVGVEDYEAAAGHVVRDLFSERDDGYMQDAGLVRDLAQQKLERKAKELEADWKWARAMLDPGYGFSGEFGRVYPQPINVPKKIRKEIDRLDARHDELVNLDDADWTEELEAEADRNTARREELQEQIREHMDFTPEDRARAGCIVTVGGDGDFQVHYGLVSPEDMERDKNQGGDAGNGQPSALSETATEAAPQSPEQTVRKEHGFTQSLIEDLKAHRLQITRAHLAVDFETSFDLALYSLWVDILHAGYRPDPLDLKAVEIPLRSSMNDLKDTPADRMLTARRESLNLAWIGLPPPEGFAAMCALSVDEKQALFAWCIAQTLTAQLAFDRDADPVAEAVGERLGIDFAAHWRPTADNYWGRVKKDHGLEVGRDVLGERWHRNHARDKKPVLAKALEAAFSAEPPAALGLDDETRVRATQWLPPGMAYDAVAEADSTPADEADDPRHGDPMANEPVDDAVPADSDATEAADGEALPAFLADDGHDTGSDPAATES